MAELSERLGSNGVLIPCGPFKIRVSSALPAIAAGLHSLYADFPLFDADNFVDFEVKVHAPSLLRRYVRPQVVLSCDDRFPFKPLPLAQAFPMLEWGLNWVISSHAHEYLVIHAAVVERDGRALILAADPGSGKSTLCAALVHQGWRLLSDELALLSLADGQVMPIARPISLKNRSIDIARALGTGVEIGPVCRDTAKGSIAHMKPPALSVAALGAPARPALVIFPQYTEGSSLISEREGQAYAFVELARHAFNFPLLASDAFDAIGRLLDQVEVFRVRYASFDQALPEVERLWQATR